MAENRSSQAPRGTASNSTGAPSAASARSSAGSEAGDADTLSVRRGPRPKMASRKASALPVWESATDDIPTGRGSGLSAEELEGLNEEDHVDLDSVKYGAEPIFEPPGVDELPPLKSYEEVVLKIETRVVEEAKAVPDTPAVADDSTSLLVQNRDALDENTATDENAAENKRLIKVATELMRDPTYREIATSSDIVWNFSAGRFIQKPEHGTLHGENVDNAVAICEDAALTFAHFDCQAELRIDSGDVCGLIFRGVSLDQYCVLRMDAGHQRIQLREQAGVRRNAQGPRAPKIDNQKNQQILKCYRFTPLKVRNNDTMDERYVTIGRLEMSTRPSKTAFADVDTSFAKVTNAGATFEPNCGPEKAFDETPRTKYTAMFASEHQDLLNIGPGDVARTAVVIQFSDLQSSVAAFRFVTAHDRKARDPVSWVVHGSYDGVEWILLHAQMGDYDTPTQRDRETAWFDLKQVSIPAPLRRECWHHVRIRAAGNILSVWLDDKLIGTFIADPVARRGGLGVLASRSKVSIKGLSSVDIQDSVKQADQAAYTQELEIRRREKQERLKEAVKWGSLRAIKLVQDVMKIKLGFIKRRMKVYTGQTKGNATEAQVRGRRMLSWFTVLSVMSKIASRLRKPEVLEQIELAYLRSLPPPPPPPPAEDPPDEADEDLYYRYQMMKIKYEPQWASAGKRVLGVDKFEKLRTMPGGPAGAEKLHIAQKCLERAMEVMDERQHQELIKQAWLLENDRCSWEDVDQADFRKWVDASLARLGGEKRRSGSKQALIA